MKNNCIRNKIIPILTGLFCMLLSNATFSQAVGDYGSSATMNWNGGTWLRCVTTGTWAGATTTTTAPTVADNVWIQAGHTVTVATAKVYSKDLHVAGTITCTTNDFTTESSNFTGNIEILSTGTVNNAMKWIIGSATSTATTISIATGGKFLFLGGSRISFWGATGCSFNVINNGYLGATTWATNAGPIATIANNVNLTFSGIGLTVLQKINVDNNAPQCNIVIDQDMVLTANSGIAILMAKSSGVTNTSVRTFTINAGRTVTLTSGSWFGNNVQNTAIDANNIYNINGTLDASAASIYFGCTTNSTAGQSGSTNSQIINIGATGVFKCGSVIKLEKPQTGQTLAVNVATGGKITYASGIAYQTYPSANTFNIASAPYSLLTNNNSNVEFIGSTATSIVLNSDVVANNISFGSATTLTGASNLTVNGLLTLSGKLTNNIGNIILGSGASFSGSTSNYIDLSSGGSFTRNGVTTNSTLFPIGSGSYTPLTLVNTTGTPSITTKLKTSFDNAVQDASKVVNLQWSVTSSVASTSDITFQFNSSNAAASFNVASSCDLGNFTSAWSAKAVGVPSGSDPYTVSATALAIPTTTNLYVIGNTGQVAMLGSTISTWTGAVSSDWADVGNWSNGVPSVTYSAYIPAGLSRYPIISASQNVKDLSIQTGASLVNNSILNIYGLNIADTGTITGNGIFYFSGSSAQTVTGAFSVKKVAFINALGVINNGTFTVTDSVYIYSGGLTGTAPIYAANIPVFFGGNASVSSGLLLSPSSGNIGNLTVNGSGSLILSNAAQVNNLTLINGTLNNSTANITILSSLTRAAGLLSTGAIYSGAIPVNYIGTTAVNSGYELTPASGSISVFTLSGSDVYTMTSAFVSTGDIVVNSGTLKMSANITAQNITVATGALLNSDNASTTTARRTITVGNGSAGNDAVLTVNGTLGNGTKWSNDGIDIEVSANAKTFTVNGSGTIGISGLRPALNANSRTLDIVINTSMNLHRDNGGAAYIEPALTLQNGTCTYNRTLTVPSGVTVTFKGNAGLHALKNVTGSTDELINNYPSSSSNQGDCIYNIAGTLDLSNITGTTVNLSTTSYSGNTQSVLVNVKNGGTLKLGNILKMYTAQVGQTANIVAEDNSTVIFNSTATQTILLTTGGGTVPTLSFYNLVINNSNGVNFINSPIVRGTLTQTSGNISGAPITMGGSTAQTIVPNGFTIENLTINNASGVSGAPTVTNTLYVTNGNLADYSNMTNCTVVFNGSVAQTIGSSLATVKNLTINNSNGVSLSGATTVTGILNLQSGKLQIGNYNLIIWSSASITANTPLNSFISTNGTGAVKYTAIATTAFSLPIGTSTTYNPITLTPTTATDFYVRVANGNTPALTTVGGTLDITKSLNRTWDITATSPSATIVTLGYLGTTDANTGFDNSGSDIALLHKNSTDWEYVGGGAVIPGAGSYGYKSATFTNITSFSPFTIVNPGAGAVYVGGGSSSFSDIYRSAASGSWGNAAVWELYDNGTSAWTTTVTTPTATSTVTVRTGHIVTINTQAGVGTLTIESGATLNSSVNATVSTPIVLTVGKPSSIIRNYGTFGCTNGSLGTVGGDGISIAIANNCTSFSFLGSGSTGIGSLYALAGSNNLNAVIDADMQLRYSSTSANKVALSLLDIGDSTFSGSRTLVINAGRTVSFYNTTSCLHASTFSSAGSYNAYQGNLVYDIQGTLDLKGGDVYITSSAHVNDSLQMVKLNVGTTGKLIIGGDFNMAKIQSKQTVYVNVENGGLIDASAASLTNTNFYGPSTNATTGYGSNYVWMVMGGINSTYKRICGSGTNAKVFNLAVAPTSGNYAAIYGNPVSVATYNSGTSDLYTVGLEAGISPALNNYSPNYAINRKWKVAPSLTDDPYKTIMKFGFTGNSAVDANVSYSPTFPAFTSYYGATVPAGTTDCYQYNGLNGKWFNISQWNNIVPVTGTMGTTWQQNFYETSSLVAPYHFIILNAAAPFICN